MRIKLIFSLTVITAMILGSCATSNEVAGGGIFQKRKYNDGFYWNRNSNLKESSGKDEKGLNIFKDEEKSSAKYVGSSSLYNETTNDLTIFAVNEKVADEIQIDEANSPALNSSVILVNKNELPENNSSSQADNQKTSVIEKTKEYRNTAKKENKRNNNKADDMFIIAVILAILIPPLGVAVYTNIDWKKVLICLILTILFFLPGMIYALLVVFDKI